MPSSSRPRILVVAAHADDETLGAGGALASHAASGADLCVLILSTSATSRPGLDHAAINDHRRGCATKAAALYGAGLYLHDLPDNRFDTIPLLDITQRIEGVIGDFGPTLVYTHSGTDLSRDHQLVAAATAAATRPAPGTSVRTVLAYEVRSATDWSPTGGFHPTWYQELTPAAVAVKMQALKIYNSEMRPFPHTRSLDAIAAQLTHRGTQIGTAAAEAFHVIRHLP